MTSAFHLAPIARLLAERMLNCVVEGMVIGLFAWLLLQVVGRRNSSTRFAVWFAALLGIASLPLIQSAITSNSISRSAASAVTLPSSWAQYIFLAWALIAGLALARVGIGLWQLSKLRASCIAVDTATLDPVLQKTLADTQSLRPVALCRSNQLRVPTAIGFLKPIVVLPMWAMEELSTLELNSILIHELTHLRRHDDWTNLAQQILKALLFFHPAVWWIESKLALEREMACDDAVLAETANPRSYAQCLVSIAEKSVMRRGIALAQAAVNRVRQTSLRVSQILDASRPSATRVWKPALYSVTGFAVLCLIASSRTPELVAFQDKAPSFTSTSEAIPGGTSFSRAESNLLTGGMLATPVSMHIKTATPRATKAMVRHHNRKQDLPKPIEAKLATPAVAPAQLESTTPDLIASASNLESNTPERTSSAPNVEPSKDASLEKSATPQTVVVMMRTEQYSQDGVLWQVRVWKLTVFDASRSLANLRIPAKNI